MFQFYNLPLPPIETFAPLGASFIVTTFIYCYHPYILSLVFKDRKLEKVLQDIKKSIPGISKVKVVSTLGRTQCVDKKIIYINTIGNTESEIIEKVLHEYAHVLNSHSRQHCDHFWLIYNDLLSSLVFKNTKTKYK
jgi:hypothetical protein